MPVNEENNKHLKIALGSDNFKETAREYDVFVDKSLFIKEIIDSSAKSILITYPRRWGKTLNLDMLKTFFEPESKDCLKKIQLQHEIEILDINLLKKQNLTHYFNPLNIYNKVVNLSKKKELKDAADELKHLECNRDIFNGGKIILSSGDERKFNSLQIAHVDDGKYMSHQGTHPTIFISLKDVVGNSLNSVEDKLKVEISKLFFDYNYIYDSLNSKLDKSPIDEEALQKFTNIVRKTASIAELKESINFLSELLFKYHGQRVYVLVDEFDKPVNSLLEEYLGKEHTSEKDRLVKDVTKLISQTLCSPVSKTNKYVEKLILTGIFDTTQKESGSGCNNVNVYGISDINFSKSFGFSNEEVAQLVDKFSFDEPDNTLAKIKDWYDGYSVPISINQNIDIYTPWAVMNYLNTAYKNQDFEPKNYWTQSGASVILQKLLTKESCVKSALSDKLSTLARNGSIELKFDQKISLFKYNWFSDLDNEKFFSYLLVNSGYLTVQKVDKKYIFKIPNSELLEEFTSIIPQDNEKCNKILYDLQKTSHLKVIKMIKENDAVAIEKELSEGHINCADHSMNFNFFHLAAIFGNQEVFQALLKSNCVEYLDFANDKIEGLKSIDYAFIAQNYNVSKAIKNHYQNNTDLLMKIPGWAETFFCYYKLISFVGGGAVSGVADLGKELVLGSLNVPNKATSYVVYSILSSILSDNIGQAYSNTCKQYSEYNEIDITQPRDFKSIKQFEKYLLTHKQAYVTVNNNCNDKDEQLSELSHLIFENSFYSNEEIKFTLCLGNIENHQEL